MWFRQDLRITDNPALNEACLKGDIIPVFIHDNVNHPNKQIGSASKWWLHQSLLSSNNNLDGELITLTGDQKLFLNYCQNQELHQWFGIEITNHGKLKEIRQLNQH